jgi:hypothetical protein
MPIARFQMPDGRVGRFEVPEGTTPEQAQALISQQLTGPSDSQPAAVSIGKTIMGIPRQFGLTARYALEGLPAMADTVGAAVRVPAKAMGLDIPTLASTGKRVSDAIGLPEPRDANERVIGDGTRMGFGMPGMAGPAQAAEKVTQGGTKAVMQALAANPAQQVGAAVGAGGAGGSVREAGGGPWAQFSAALAGGLAGAGAATGIDRAFQGVVSLLRPGMKAQEVEQTITLVLKGSGVDWSTLPEKVKQGMRAEVAQAMRTGQNLNPDAARRLVDFKATGATPTRGMLTQNPSQITREQNLAKVGANSTDIGLQKLPNLQNENAQTMLRNLDDLGARGAPDAYAAGQRVVGALGGYIDRSRGNINSLYSQARDTAGRSAELDGATFTRAANEALDEALLGYAVPSSVQNKLNQIAKGEVPFTVDFAEQLKTTIGNIGAAGKGDATTKAMGVIRKALDQTPLRPAPTVNPGNLPAVRGTVPTSPSVLGQESITAFNRARAANRGLMQRVESSPALEAVYKGIKEGQPVDPDRFVQQFITGSGASVADVRQLQRAMPSGSEAQQAVRGFIAQHLKGAATNNTDDVVKFSSSAFSKALDNIGERKLAVFFSPQEIAQLQAIKRAGTLMQAQPVGTAVNNSNSGALVVAKTLDFLDRVAGKLPLGADTMIQGMVRGVQQGNALNAPRALVMPRPRNALMEAGIPPLLYGNLLAAPSVE